MLLHVSTYVRNCFTRNVHTLAVFFYRLLACNMVLILHPVYSKSPNSELAEILHRPIRSLTFPEESTLGVSVIEMVRERSRKGTINLSVTCTFFLKLFLALAIPLEDPYKSVSIAQFFEATYNLPTNASEEHLWLDAGDDNRKRRSLDRATLYPVVESKFDK